MINEWKTLVDDENRLAAEARKNARAVERADKPARVPRAQRPIAIELHIQMSACGEKKARFRGWALLKDRGERSKIYAEKNRKA